MSKYRVTFNADLLPDEPSLDANDYPTALGALIERMGELHYSDMRDTYKQANDYSISYRYDFAHDDDDADLVSLHVKQIVHPTADDPDTPEQTFDFATIASLR